MAKEQSTKSQGQIVQIDDGQIRDHLVEIVRGSVEETLNGLLQAEADQLCNARRYERTATFIPNAEAILVGNPGPGARQSGCPRGDVRVSDFYNEDERNGRNVTQTLCGRRVNEQAANTGEFPTERAIL